MVQLNQPVVPCDLLIRDCSAVLPDFHLLEDAAIAVGSKRILEIGPASQVCPKYTPQSVIWEIGRAHV